MSKAIKIELTKDEAAELKSAAQEVQYVFHFMGNVLGMVENGMSTGFLDNPENTGNLIALFSLLSRAMEHAAEKEGDCLAKFGLNLKTEVRNAA